jgi:subtilisin-like proprotein convertase family protein
MDSNHDEFKDRFDKNASCEIYEAEFDWNREVYSQHGTTVASILGAEGNNTQCAVGIAPQVTLSSCVVTSGTDQVDPTLINGTWLAYKVDQFDISQNSYGFPGCRGADQGAAVPSGGFPDVFECPFTHTDPLIWFGEEYDDLEFPCDVCTFPSLQASFRCREAIIEHCRFFFEKDVDACSGVLEMLTREGECIFRTPRDSSTEALETGAREGRNGKGIIYVFASGNDYAAGDDTNYRPRLASRFIIAVGAVGQDGIKAQYSNPGASLFVSAPGGDVEYVANQMAARAGGGCQRAGIGTSISCPVVSGVIALMLEANADLTWRDVQGILANSSQPVTHPIFDDETKVVNGAGFWHSNLYGFGIVNASAAVAAAQNWLPYGEEELLTVKSENLNLQIGDNPNDPIITELSIEVSGPMIIVENVEVILSIDHFSRGHLKISLTSPNGTISELTPGKRPENSQLDKDRPWRLRTVRSWGESAEGTWTIAIADVKAGDVSQCADIADWSVDAFDYPDVDCVFVEYNEELHDPDILSTVNLLYGTGANDACCACGGGNGPIYACSDFPGFLATCNRLESEEVCENGVVDELYAFYALRDGLGRTVQDACCVLDGGLFYPDPDAFEDKLLGWEINIYGHREFITPAPSADPSVSPTMISSVTPIVVPPSTVVPNSGSNSSDLHGGLLLILLAISVGGLFS